MALTMYQNLSMSHYSAMRCYHAFFITYRTLTSCVEYLKKRGDYGAAVGLLRLLLGQSQYGRSLRGHWLERLSLNLDFHLKERRKVSLSLPYLHVLYTSFPLSLSFSPSLPSLSPSFSLPLSLLLSLPNSLSPYFEVVV